MNNMNNHVNLFGLRKGTSAPYFFDILAIFGQSVETITRVICFDFIAASIVCAISGFPPNNLIFLLGNLFDFFFAGIIASILGCRFA